MSVSTELTRLDGLKTRLRTKLSSLLGLSTSATLEQCVSATEGISAATQATPSITVSTAGLITAKATQTAGLVAAGTKSSTKQLTVQAAQTITPGTYNKYVYSGRYLTGTQTIKGDSNLVAANIASGVSIFGVTGTHSGGGGGGEAYIGCIYADENDCISCVYFLNGEICDTGRIHDYIDIFIDVDSYIYVYYDTGGYTPPNVVGDYGGSDATYINAGVFIKPLCDTFMIDVT